MANCPAMRPTFTTGEPPENVRTTAICRNTRNSSRMWLAPCSEKLSAQSPPCSRKAWPAATSASARFSLSASPAKTSGGYEATLASTSARSALSGYSGTWMIGFDLQLSGDQGAAMTAFSVTRVRGPLAEAAQ